MSIIKNKIWPVVIGIFCGICISVFLFANGAMSAFGEDEAESPGWNDVVAMGNVFEWQDVFNLVGLGQSEIGKGLYNLVYNKLVVAPDQDAFEAVAQNYGLTKEEAEAVAKGSVSTIYHNSHIKGSNKSGDDLTLEELNELSAKLIADFQDLKEYFELKEEIEASITPTDIFSNGDLADSGFDLIYDLSLIEQILFLENSEVSTGDEYEDAMDSPFIPEPGSGPVEVEYDDDDDSSGDNFEEVDGVLVAKVQVGEHEIAAEVLDEDVCDYEDDMADVLVDYESANPKVSDDDDDDDDSSGNSGDDDDDAAGVYNVDPAPASSWGSVFCPELNDPKASSEDLPAISLGEKNQDEAQYEDISVNVQIPLCLTIELIGDTASDKTVSSNSCVNCEIEEINALLNETLSHSLAPNKVTGNIMEPAKCKQTFQTETIPVDLKVIAISSPVQTPANDDLLSGNVFKEWNDFVKKIGWSELKAEDEYIEEFNLTYVPEDVSTVDVLVEIAADQDNSRSDATKGYQNASAALQGNIRSVYSTALYPEVVQMTTYFEIMERVFQNTVASLKVITTKPNIE